MSQATLDLLWVPSAMLPANFVIVGVEERTGMYKERKYIFYNLILQHKSGQMYQFEAKFGDKNFLINTHGPDTMNWTSKIIGMEIGENKYKRLCAPST